MAVSDETQRLLKISNGNKILSKGTFGESGYTSIYITYIGGGKYSIELRFVSMQKARLLSVRDEFAKDQTFYASHKERLRQWKIMKVEDVIESPSSECLELEDMIIRLWAREKVNVLKEIKKILREAWKKIVALLSIPPIALNVSSILEQIDNILNTIKMLST